MLATANLRKNKSQAVSLLIFVLIAAMFLNIGLVLYFDVEDYFDKRAEELHTPHLMIVQSENITTDEQFTWLRDNPQIAEMERFDAVAASVDLTFNNVKTNGSVVFSKVEQSQTMNPLTLIGDYLPLGDNSIYVPYVLKAAGGYNLGDEFIITLSGEDIAFTIAGFTEDVLLGDTMSSFVRVYLSDTCFMLIEEDLYQHKAVYIALRLIDPDSALTIQAEYREIVTQYALSLGDVSMSDSFLRSRTYDRAKMARTFMSTIIAIIVTAFAFILLVVSLIVMRFGIANNIEESMTNIGVLKSAGFKSRQIISSILLQFGGLAVVGGVLGIIAAAIIMPVITGILEEQSAMIWNLGFNAAYSAVALIFTIAMVVLVSWLAARRISKLHPLIALRGGILTHNFKKNSVPFDKSHGALIFLLAMKQLAKSKGQNAMIAAIVMAVTVASVIGVSSYIGIGVDTFRFATMLVGEVPDAVFVSTNSSETDDLAARLSERPDVRKAFGDGDVFVTVGDFGVHASISRDFSQYEGSMLVEGRYPKHNNEITAGDPFLRQANKKIGDTVTLQAGGNESDYIITGLIQTVNNDGNLLLMTYDGLIPLWPGFEFEWIYVYLEEGVDATDFVENVTADMEGMFSSAQVVKDQVEAQFGMFGSIFAAVAAGLLAITAVVVILVLYLVIKASILRRKREIGIQRAIGFTTVQIMNQIALAYMPVIAAAVALGGIGGALGMNPFFVAVMRGMGIVRADFPVQLGWAALTCVALTVLAYLVSMLVAWRIHKISAYALIVE